MPRSLKIGLLCGVGSAAAFASGAALAQTDDEIIVTATKRAQTLQEVPFSINAQTQEDIQKTGSQNLEDLSRNVAGLIIQNLGPGQSQVAIRGVSAGQIVRDQPGVKEQVGVYLDESVISLSLFTPDLDLFDLNRVETLRGPQGTLFGSGSIGGTIRYITNQPKLGEVEGVRSKAASNIIDSGGAGGHLKGVAQPSARRIMWRCAHRRLLDPLWRIHRRPARGRRTSPTTSTDGDRSRRPEDCRSCGNRRRSIKVTPRVIYQKDRYGRFQSSGRIQSFRQPVHDRTRTAVNFQDRRQFLLAAMKSSRTISYIGDLNGRRRISVAVASDLDYKLHGSRVFSSAATRARSPARFPWTSVFPTPAVLLPSNLRDTTEVQQWTQEIADCSSAGDNRFDWLARFFLHRY